VLAIVIVILVLYLSFKNEDDSIDMRNHMTSPYIYDDADRLIREARWLSITYPKFFKFSVGFTKEEEGLYPNGYTRLSGENGFPLQRFRLVSEDASPDVMSWSRTSQFSDYAGFWQNYYQFYMNAQETIKQRAELLENAGEHFALEAWLRFFKIFHLTNMKMVKTTQYLVPTPTGEFDFNFNLSNVDGLHALGEGMSFSDKVRVLSLVKDSPVEITIESARGVLELPEKYIKELFNQEMNNMQASNGCYGYIFRYQPGLDI
jgi:hypothetical protein